MAVATPVLERKVSNDDTQQQPATKTYLSQDELHNSRIRDNYARLINPQYKIEDLFTEPAVQEQQAPVQQTMDLGETTINASSANISNVQNVAQPYLVENARADAAIFRADNPIYHMEEVNSASYDDEENEDLKPTQTTIQYRTVEENKATKTTSENKASPLSKKEKIIIAAFVSIVVAMFILVIINSAIIANLNNDISALQNNIATVRGALAGVNGEIANIVSPENIADFAETHNLVLK
jgi:cell division protein FtsL